MTTIIMTVARMAKMMSKTTPTGNPGMSVFPIAGRLSFNDVVFSQQYFSKHEISLL